jgi:hypothetical protein
VTWKAWGRHQEGQWREVSERKESKKKGPNSQEGQETQFIDRKRASAGKVIGIYNKKQEGSFEEEGKQTVEIV